MTLTAQWSSSGGGCSGGSATLVREQWGPPSASAAHNYGLGGIVVCCGLTIGITVYCECREPDGWRRFLMQIDTGGGAGGNTPPFYTTPPQWEPPGTAIVLGMSIGLYIPTLTPPDECLLAVTITE